jgi:hypothetical protein
VARAGLGYDCPHVAGVRFSRYAYFEALADERCDTTTGFLERALVAFNAMGIRAERLLSDTGENYVFHAVADFMQRLAALPASSASTMPAAHEPRSPDTPHLGASSITPVATTTRPFGASTPPHHTGRCLLP